MLNEAIRLCRYIRRDDLADALKASQNKPGKTITVNGSICFGKRSQLAFDMLRLVERIWPKEQSTEESSNEEKLGWVNEKEDELEEKNCLAETWQKPDGAISDVTVEWVKQTADVILVSEDDIEFLCHRCFKYQNRIFIGEGV